MLLRLAEQQGLSVMNSPFIYLDTILVFGVRQAIFLIVMYTMLEFLLYFFFSLYSWILLPQFRPVLWLSGGNSNHLLFMVSLSPCLFIPYSAIGSGVAVGYHS